jgi:hypothetical protein
MTDRKFRNRVQTAREMREEIRKNRFLGLDGDGAVIQDRSGELKNLLALNKHMSEVQIEFGISPDDLNHLSEGNALIEDMCATKVSFDGKNWDVVVNEKKLEAQGKEITKLENKLKKLLKKEELWGSLDADDEIMVIALQGGLSNS